MMNHVAVPGPGPAEQSRLVAEAVAELHKAIMTIVENAEHLLPGEAVEEFRTAWISADRSFDSMVRAILAGMNQNPPATSANQPVVSIEALDDAELAGPVGAAKLSLLRRLKDGFYRLWNSMPRTTHSQQKASEAGADYLEYGATVVGSIPGYDMVEEFLLMSKQLLAIRARRMNEVDA